MKRLAITAGAISLIAGAAHAGGVDRSGQSVRALFEKGGASGAYAEFSFGTVNPTANGNAGGDPLEAYSQLGFAVKQDMGDAFSFALIADQPFGASVQYPAGAPFGGSGAHVQSRALTAVGRYKLPSNFSVFGGLRFQKLSGTIVSAPDTLNASSKFNVGYLVGVAYEKPEIAMRVALTYNSKITNKMSGTQNGGAINFNIVTPQSWNLEAQTGIAANTLLFGSIRYVGWNGFNVTTPLKTYASFTGNTTTYSVGLGRKFTENWSGAVTLGYEKPGVRPTTTALAPTTGSTSIGLGATYTQGNTKITAGVTYAKLGDQNNGGGVTWTGNKAIAAGIRVGVSF